jgi:dipeptidyl aminopeptidase/acylaminoacyl peptidase
MKLILRTSFLVLLASVSFSQSRELTLERIMADPDWLGRQPENPYWADDGRSVYYERKQEGSEERKLFQVGLDGSVLREVPDEIRGSVDFEGGDWSSDRSRKVYSRDGDLFSRDVATGVVRQLTRTAEEEADPRFMKGDDRIWFHRGKDVFVRDLASGLESQPAVLVFEKDPDEPKPYDFLREEQVRLLDTIRSQKGKRDAERERARRARTVDPTRVPPPYYLGDDVELGAESLSPTGEWMLLVLRPKERKDGPADKMARFVTEDGYLQPKDVRKLVGTEAPVSDRLVVLHLSEQERKDVSLDSLPGIEDDPLRELRGKAAQRQEKKSEETGEVKTTSRAVRVGSGGLGGASEDGILWSDDGSHLVLQLFSEDNKDRWLAAVDLPNRSLKPLERFTDDAWINWSLNEVGFLSDSATLYYTSEQSGYSQLYTRSLEAGQNERLTRGDFVVSDVTESPDRRYLYYKANAAHPGIYEVYRYDLEREIAEEVTRLGGMNDFALSPDGRKLLIVHSDTVAPPELYVQDARVGGEATRLTDTLSALFRSFDWVQPEIVPVPSTHQERPIYSRLYRPGRARGGKRPAVLFVHGAGYLQNSHQGWSSYFREFMFHSLLTQRGYVVLDMDYRGSAGYGRDWRTAIYRNMGSPELEDLEDGVRFLAAKENVDPKRVGVYGGSYGGFLTLMSLFKKPDLFACGAALRPVTDWSDYNDPYTSHILNIPSVDPEAYERSSPIEYASGLAKPLLIAHGMVDDNVFFKDSVRLVQRLIELGKTNWELAVYPVESHGFREPSSWLDEYRRILKLFESHLE